MKNSMMIFSLFLLCITLSNFAFNQPTSSLVSIETAFVCNEQPKLARQRAHIEGYKPSERQRRTKKIVNITIGVMVGIGLAIGLSIFGVFTAMTVAIVKGG
jgi:hypothetical protein